MKSSYFISIFCLLNFCFTQVIEDRCASEFETILESKCRGIGSCSYNLQSCIPISSCSGNTQEDCEKNIPPDYGIQKCKFTDGRCQKVKKVCSDYNFIIDSFRIQADTCSGLDKETNLEGRCYFSLTNILSTPDNRECITHYDSCSSITSLEGKTETEKETLCNKNIPFDFKYKCHWEESACTQTERSCSEYFHLYKWANKDNCRTLKASTGATCVFDTDGCIEAYPCSHWDYEPDNCNGKTPLNDAGDAVDYLFKCFYDENESTEHRCKKKRKECNDYINGALINGENACEQYIAKDTDKKQCFLESSSDSCVEQFKSCQLYEENEVDKSRANCEKIRLTDTNKKCVYIKEEHRCEEGNVYNNCNDYKGSDKKICENIVSPKRNSNCVLAEDLTCKEREFHCKEAYDRYDCLIYAKPTDNNKKCVWSGSSCYEEIKGCEDYVYKNSGSEAYCNSLEVYNGKKCYYDWEKCKSKDKVCDEARSREECKLIEKTGVSDPAKKICEWTSSSDTGNYCIENYKYCSDYRPKTTSASTSEYSNYLQTCRNIKPYNPKTNTLDVAYTCDIKDPLVGCEKVPKECSAANGNKILCHYISPIIKDKRIKYCVYARGSCQEMYKTCELVDENKLSTKCSGNIPEGFLGVGHCELKFDTDGNPIKCETKENKCISFDKNDYEDLCLNIHHDCSFNSAGCINSTKSCNTVKFYTANKDNEGICNSYKSSDKDYICTLKEDKSGCEFVHKESIPFYYAINTNNNNSFKLKVERIYLFVFLLSLLF